MRRDITGEPIPWGGVDVPAFRWFMERIQWFVLGSAIVFGLTVSLAKLPPLFIALSSIAGLGYHALVLVAIRRRRSWYFLIAAGLWGAGMGLAKGISRFRSDWDDLHSMALSLLLPTLLLWWGRRWVMQYCRLDEPAVEARE